VTPGITAQEYYDRRVKLAKALPANSIAVLAASDIRLHAGSGSVFYKFHQDPDFLYLTGNAMPLYMRDESSRSQASTNQMRSRS
jgi:hypothetical protein